MCSFDLKDFLIAVHLFWLVSAPIGAYFVCRLSGSLLGRGGGFAPFAALMALYLAAVPPAGLFPEWLLKLPKELYWLYYIFAVPATIATVTGLFFPVLSYLVGRITSKVNRQIEEPDLTLKPVDDPTTPELEEVGG